ncbi:hypothetical protein V1331_12055 (plasmid) [Levilactobacillus brevis]|uniref:hypothetical protein n=1 Tax=Levilactobacillus brevis TaxID=1580 RepID=UPI003DA27908
MTYDVVFPKVGGKKLNPVNITLSDSSKLTGDAIHYPFGELSLQIYESPFKDLNGKGINFEGPDDIYTLPNKDILRATY